MEEDEVSSFSHSPTRKRLIAELESLRSSQVIVLVDQGPQTPPALLRHFFDHIRDMHGRTMNRLDLVVWSTARTSQRAHRQDLDTARRLTALFREYTREFSVLVPHEAFGFGTLLAVAADQVLMHPMASLGKLADNTPLLSWQALSQLAEPEAMPMLRASFLNQVDAAQLAELEGFRTAFRQAVSEMGAQRVRRRSEWLETLCGALDDGTLACSLGRRHAKQLGVEVLSQNADVQKVMWQLYASYESAMAEHSLAVVESAGLAQVYEEGQWRCVVEKAH